MCAEVNVALACHAGHVVVLECDALGLECSHLAFYIVADRPCQGRRLVASSILRSVDVDCGRPLLKTITS